jgi:NitT/TauT family transport system ATP-binding protein
MAKKPPMNGVKLPTNSAQGNGMQLKSVTKQFTDPAGRCIDVFNNLSIEFEPNQLHVVMGASGCGKSTLGYLLAGFTQPDSGEVSLNCVPVQGPGPDRLFVFQETALWPWMTVTENIIFGPQSRGEASVVELKSRAAQMLVKFGLADFSDNYPDQLSGGMKRRAEIAQALINRPKIMILDEPFRGLDVMTREILQEYYLALFEETRQTTIFITSELEEALFLADKIYFMGGSPTQIQAVIDIKLPRPRNFDVTLGQEYLAYKQKAMDLLFRDAREQPGKFKG